MFWHFGVGPGLVGPGPPWGLPIDGLLDVRLVVSRTGKTLNYTTARNARSPFVPLGVNTCGASTPSVAGGWCAPRSATQLRQTSPSTSAMWMASGYVRSPDGLEIFLYLQVQPNTHAGYKVHVWGTNQGIRLLRMRTDGFVSIDAPYLFSQDLRLLPSYDLLLPWTLHCITSIDRSHHDSTQVSVACTVYY